VTKDLASGELLHERMPLLYEHIQGECRRLAEERGWLTLPQARLTKKCMRVRPPLTLILKAFGCHRTHSRISSELQAHALNASYTCDINPLTPKLLSISRFRRVLPWGPHRSSVTAASGVQRHIEEQRLRKGRAQEGTWCCEEEVVCLWGGEYLGGGGQLVLCQARNSVGHEVQRKRTTLFLCMGAFSWECAAQPHAPGCVCFAARQPPCFFSFSFLSATIVALSFVGPPPKPRACP